jgi:hypothetical protein
VAAYRRGDAPQRPVGASPQVQGAQLFCQLIARRLQQCQVTHSKKQSSS